MKRLELEMKWKRFTKTTMKLDFKYVFIVFFWDFPPHTYTSVWVSDWTCKINNTEVTWKLIPEILLRSLLTKASQKLVHSTLFRVRKLFQILFNPLLKETYGRGEKTEPESALLREIPPSPSSDAASSRRPPALPPPRHRAVCALTFRPAFSQFSVLDETSEHLGFHEHFQEAADALGGHGFTECLPLEDTLSFFILG